MSWKCNWSHNSPFLCDLFLKISERHLEGRLYRQFLSFHLGISFILQRHADRVPGTTLNKLCVIALQAESRPCFIDWLKLWGQLILLFYPYPPIFLVTSSCLVMSLPGGMEVQYDISRAMISFAFFCPLSFSASLNGHVFWPCFRVQQRQMVVGLTFQISEVNWTSENKSSTLPWICIHPYR